MDIDQYKVELNKIFVEEISLEIFSYLEDHIKYEINEKYLLNKILRTINSSVSKILLCFHFQEIPFPEMYNIDISKMLIEKNIDKKKYSFSHFCCNNQGICYNGLLEKIKKRKLFPEDIHNFIEVFDEDYDELS